MNKQFLIFLGIGLAVVSALLTLVWTGTKGAHLDLQGEVLKVRSMASDETHSVVLLDFRVTNPSEVQFVTRTAELTLTKADGTAVEGDVVARSDVDRLLQYNKLLGPKYNQTLIMKDPISGKQTVDRMVAFTVPVPEADVESRKSCKLRLIDLDGAVFEVAEKR